MVDVSIDGDRAVFTVEGMHKLWSLRSQIEIPLTHITGVEINSEQVGRWWHGFKLIGTDAPGLFAAGTFYYHGELVFWDVFDTTKTIIVSLEHERYKKLIVEVADPDITAAAIETALRSTQSSRPPS
jgi:hypothetical protein